MNRSLERIENHFDELDIQEEEVKEGNAPL